MQPNSVTLKVTVAGRKFIHILAVLATGDEDKIRGFVERNYAAYVLRDYPVDEILAAWLSIYEQTGGLKVHKVFTIQRFSGYVVVKAKNSDDLYLMKLKLDDLAPHGVIELEFDVPPEDE